jgi:hypothetical protein
VLCNFETAARSRRYCRPFANTLWRCDEQSARTPRANSAQHVKSVARDDPPKD